MKVLYILHSTVMGGATISFKNMVEGVLRNGVKPVVVYPKKQKNEAIRHLENIGCECYECFIAMSVIPQNVSFIKKTFLLWVVFLKKIISFINLFLIVQKVKPDIIHTNTGVVQEGANIARIKKIPHVWHIREYQTRDFNLTILPNKNAFVRKLSNSNTIFITKELRSYFNPKGDSFVIYNPIFRIEELPNMINVEKERYILVANRISKEKGLEDIIEGCSCFLTKHKDFKLKIAGFGNDKYIRELQDLCRDLKISENVEFLGYVSNMRDLIYNASVLLVGSYYEAFGRMTAEANLLGTFVIGRNSGGTKEIIEVTGGGSLFYDKCEILSLLEKYLNLQDKKAILLNAKQRAIDNFTSEVHCEKIMEVYNT